ncbi:BTAD domain-containing putative transcriptional regulator [Dactylosporangium matsuzakiense]|uniref:ATPase AAA n=1 Tax=Dactylosporangium matsuzakiense TaxID=53360 RepID=A0A9W6KKM0_9ACTN|nr:BTAD domain-containing putative transcriptional regulator [Dactylosporangium matsuzakiense]UWZ43938.1 AAA family ATPase [Dactylosporangium matsuzakiense]GLL03218.1 ATPase AAA [Dactylosporangium matsuzakiense]
MLLRVLGPFAVETGAAVDLGGPRQRAVLALLLSARGDVVSVDRMIEDLWRGEAPPRAIASLQAYVSNLRRLLEPARARRTPARLLVSAPPGYAIRLPPDAVDAWRFERLFAEARALTDDPHRALRLLCEGLDLWQGEAYAEFAGEPWAQPEAARLAELRLAAREALLDAMVRSGAAAAAVAEADLFTRQAPLREEGWRLLALALWRSGRQADALAALRRARALLAEELGLDPGRALLDLEAAILGGDIALDRPERPALPAPVDFGTRAGALDKLFVGRQGELGTLMQAADIAPQVVLLSGEAGVGKSGLLGRYRDELARLGWLVVVGRCPEVEGAPPAWAWVEALRQLADVAPPGDLAAELRPLLDEDAGGLGAGAGEDRAGGRFRLHRAVSRWLGAAAGERPVAVVLDDLHAADAETLMLLASVAELVAPGGPPLLLVAALRPADNRERLAATMAALARRSPVRVALEGLDAEDVARLVAAFARTPVDAGTLAALAERTGGNPFYVRESAQLLASEGALVATSEVPEGVRDVLRRRLSRLPQAAVAVLRLAAVVGREADVETLVEAADADEGAVLDALEAGLIAGLLTEPAPGRVRFVHGLVRDTMYTDLSQLRRARMHARVAAATRRDDYPALAHHYARAASSDTAALAVDYAIRAAELAERRYAYDAAAEVLSGALDPAVTAPGDRDACLVDLLGRLLRAQAGAGAVAAARQTRQRAVDVAVASGRAELLVGAFTAWTVPTPWQIHEYGVVDGRLVDLLIRLLRRTDLAPADRCRLLDALTNELDDEGDERGVAAGREALDIARGLGDPRLLALGLAARGRTMSYDRDAPARRAIALELRALAVEHGLVAYHWLAEQMLGNCAAAMNEPAQLWAAVARQGSIAAAYHLAEPQAITLAARATAAHIAGDLAGARAVYDECHEHMRRQGSLHGDAFHFFATFSVLLSEGDQAIAGFIGPTRMVLEQLGPIGSDAYALALVAAGRVAEARAVRIAEHPIRLDYFASAFYTVRALAIVALGRADLSQPVIDALLPVREQLAGVSSTSIAMQPVALTLGELYRLQDRPAEATACFQLAAEVAGRWSAPHWLARAKSFL